MRNIFLGFARKVRMFATVQSRGFEVAVAETEPISRRLCSELFPRRSDLSSLCYILREDNLVEVIFPVKTVSLTPAMVQAGKLIASRM